MKKGIFFQFRDLFGSDNLKVAHDTDKVHTIMKAYNVFHNGIKIGSSLSYSEAEELRKGKYNCQIVEVITNEAYMASFSGDKIAMLERNHHSKTDHEDRDNSIHNFLNN